jgi:ubiquinone/menaquinone biosynthesis C-methylase UbiE
MESGTHVTICDINPHMLEHGEARVPTERGISPGTLTQAVLEQLAAPVIFSSVAAVHNCLFAG